MQNNTLYNKIMNIKFDVYYDADTPPYIKYASVKPSFFLSNDILNPNTHYLAFLTFVDNESVPGGCFTTCGNIHILYNDDNTKISSITFTAYDWPFLIIGDMLTDEWTLVD